MDDSSAHGKCIVPLPETRESEMDPVQTDGGAGDRQSASSESAFPQTASKVGDSGFNSGSLARNRARRSSSIENDLSQTATIPRPSASSGTKGPSSNTVSRSKSRGRHSSKVAPLPTTQQQQQHSTMQSGGGVTSMSTSMGSNSDATIAELQQRLEVMAREKVSLESAIEQEQERMFNQTRRLSGTLSPSALVPVSAGSIGGVGAMSPRWAKSHSRSSSVSSFGATSVSSSVVGITETLKADINSLRLRLADAERELVSCYNQSQIYKKELVSLRQRLGMSVDDLYLDDPLPSSIRPVIALSADHTTRPRRSQSVSSGVSSTASTPSSLARRGSGHQQHHEYFGLLPATAITSTAPPVATSGAAAVVAGGTTPRRMSQRPRSMLLSPRRSMEDHHVAPAANVHVSENTSLFSSKTSAAPPHRSTRTFK
ncbi:hypothetical protein GGI07_004595 [Coemansia sp. Benny D115]|nr:hypothetical protein GGI07_004595 [Coemansia sp. Benny D115]